VLPGPRLNHPHEGEIVTQAPNVRWGADGAKVFTVEDGGQALSRHLQPRLAGGDKRVSEPLAGQGPVARPSVSDSAA